MVKFTEKSPTGKNCIPLKNAAMGIDLPRWAIKETSFLESRLEGDAADRLAAYEDTGLSPDEIPHWIPVSERLPDKEVLVLLFLRSPKGETKITTGEIYASNNKKFDGEFCIGFDPLSPDFLNREFVTHWMPLPQPPKEEKK